MALYFMSSVEKKLSESSPQKSRVTGNIVLDKIDDFVHARKMNQYPNMSLSKRSYNVSGKVSVADSKPISDDG